MLSLRYEIRQLKMEWVNACGALKMQKGGADGKNVEMQVHFTLEDAQSLPVAHVRNSLLFQALEMEREPEERSRISHEPGAAFLWDVMMVEWPDRLDNSLFLAVGGEDGTDPEFATGREVRRLMFRHGFEMDEMENGQEKPVRFLPLMAGAGHTRAGKCIFIREEKRDRVLRRLTLGMVSGGVLQVQDDCDVNMAKLSAYIGLAASDGVSVAELEQIWEKGREGKESVPERDFEKIELTEQTVAVVDDVYGDLASGKDKSGRWKIENSEDSRQVFLRQIGKDKDGNDKAEKANYTDGYGLIAPAWGKTLNQLRKSRKPEEFYHRAWILRLPFVKGMALECDFQKYFEAHGVTKIMDLFGNERDVKNLRLILTKSMFKGLFLFEHRKSGEGERDKGAKYENTWKEYLCRLKENELSMVITGNDTAPGRITSLSYQNMSTLLPEQKQLERLLNRPMKKRADMIKLLDADRTNATEVADYLDPPEKKPVPDLPEKEESAPEEELSQAGELSPETPETDEEEQAADASEEKLLARLLRERPGIVESGFVKGMLAGAIVTRTGEYAQGRLPVAGDTRILVHDPFELLITLTKKALLKKAMEQIPRDEAEIQALLKQAMEQISRDEAKARELLKKAMVQTSRDEAKAKELLKQAAALISSKENNPPVSREGYVYAPGIKANRLLLLRSPHVSAFEDVVAATLRIWEENPVRKQYQDYFGEHTGCVFVNSYVAAGLGGADFDGDRVKCVWNEDCVSLAGENAQEIIRLLQKSTDDSFGGLPQNVKQLPIVKINGPAAQKRKAVEINKDFWENTFQTYERALSSQVGRLSNLAAGVAFTPAGDENDPGPEESPAADTLTPNQGVQPPENLPAPAETPEQTPEPLTPGEIARLQKLKELSLLTCVVGNDIDSAKTGVKPEIPSLQTRVSAGGGQTLNFAQAMKKNDALTGLPLYQKAMQAAGKAGKKVPAADLPEAFRLAPEAIETLKNWTGKHRQKAEEKAEQKARLYPLLATKEEKDKLKKQAPWWKEQAKQEQPATPEDAATPAEQTKATEKPAAPTAQEKACREAAEAIQQEREARSAAGKRQKALANLQTQRRNLLEALLENYPLYRAEEYFRAMIGARYTGKELPLYTDGEAIQYAFMTCEKREAVFAPVLFGDGKKGGKDFEYDETVITLTKHLQRYRGALEIRDKNAPNQPREAEKKDGLATLLGEKRDPSVKPWLVGLALLKHGKVTEREFVQKFARYLSAAQEEKTREENEHEGGEAHAEPQA